MNIKYLNIFIFFIISILTIMVLLILYKSLIIYNGNYSSYYNNFIIFFSINIIFLTILFFLNDDKKKNFFLFYISILVSILLIEIFLNFILKKHYVGESLLKEYRYNFYKDKGVEFDKRSSIEVYLDLQKTDKNIVPVVQPQKFNNLYTFGGVSETLTISCNEVGVWPIYKSDKFGFRKIDVKNKSDYTIAFLGDSFTWGACVETMQGIPSIIHNKTGFNVLNFGVPDSGPLKQLAIFSEYIKAIKPDLTIYLYYEGNDLSNLDLEKKDDLLIKYLDNNFSQQLRMKQKMIDKLLREKIYQSIENQKKKNLTKTK